MTYIQSLKNTEKMRGQDAARDERIENEVIVDCYDDEEVASGWFYYFEEALTFPFKATIKSQSRNGSIVNEKVDVLSYKTKNDRSWDLRFGVSKAENTAVSFVELEELMDIEADEKTIEAIEDWKYFYQH
jgi:hypothetical protein